MITAVEIDELYYAEPITTVTTPVTGLTGAEVAAILKNAATKKGTKMYMVIHSSMRKRKQVSLVTRML